MNLQPSNTDQYEFKQYLMMDCECCFEVLECLLILAHFLKKRADFIASYYSVGIADASNTERAFLSICYDPYHLSNALRMHDY